MFNSVAVIGAGAWGTALASVAARAGRAVTLYARDAAHAAHIESARENPRLPGISLAPGIAVTNDLAAAAGADITLIVTPAQHLRAAVTQLAPHLRNRQAQVRDQSLGAGCLGACRCELGLARAHELLQQLDIVGKRISGAHGHDGITTRCVCEALRAG